MKSIKIYEKNICIGKNLIKYCIFLKSISDYSFYFNIMLQVLILFVSIIIIKNELNANLDYL